MPLLQKPKFELDPEYQQLALDLDVETLAMESQVSPEEARLRSETALRALLSTKGNLPNSVNAQLGVGIELSWFAPFEALLNGGWPWRQAAYIAWASMPTPRSPKTQDELAIQFLGLTSDRAISTWRKKNPAIDQMVAVLQSAPLWEHRADAFNNLVAGMKRADADYKFFNHLKLYFEMTGDYVPLTQLAAVLKRKGDGDLSSMSEEDLASDLEEAATELRKSVNPASGAGSDQLSVDGDEELDE